MFCPQCGARTVVSETRGPFRDRRCTNAGCHLGFTTCENVLTRREHCRLCARTRATLVEVHLGSLAAGEKMGSTTWPGIGATSEPGEGVRAIQIKQKCAQAGVAG